MELEGKTVLCLGAGLVVRPFVAYLGERGCKVIVASRTLANAQKIADTVPNASAALCDVETDEGKEALDKLVPTVDAVCSLLPYVFHPLAAKVALKYNKHFLTTSYVSDGMRELEKEAIDKGLVIINECGVDPGIDHMSAMAVIDRVKESGGKIVGFTSNCGGLPAPDSNNNPLGYKFSWAPRGVLLASRNTAKLLKDGAVTEVPSIFKAFWTEPVEELGGDYELYYNRDSMPYQDIYGLHDAKDLYRGTFRNLGWCDTVQSFATVGLLSLDEHGKCGSSVDSLLDGLVPSADGSLRSRVASHLGIAADSPIFDSYEWLGLFSSTVKIPESAKTFLDVLCHLMLEKMQYAPGEKDMIVMRHTFDVEYDDGRKERITATMINYGEEGGDSSMSRTVAIPVAIAAKLVLLGKYTKPGLSIPVNKELYEPILKELESCGIALTETTASY